MIKEKDEWVISVAEAGRRLKLGKNGAYLAAKRGEIPTIRVGHRLRVPVAALNRMWEQAGQKPPA
jgi:excisionase family DNA binding protein